MERTEPRDMIEERDRHKHGQGAPVVVSVHNHGTVLMRVRYSLIKNQSNNLLNSTIIVYVLYVCIVYVCLCIHGEML